MATDIIAPSLAKKTKGSLAVGSSKTCSNGKSRENEYGNGMPKSVDRVHASARPIYHRGRLKK